MFSRIPVDGFFMEWDTDRAGGFEPLRFAPRDKMIILGLVSSLRSIDEISPFANLSLAARSRLGLKRLPT